jgi:glycosyltransferase involved in cell wall biosynthesis
MLKSAGHEVYLYHAGSIVEPGIANSYIQVVSDDTMSTRYGNKFYETYNQGWKQDDMAWIEFRRGAGLAIAKRLSSNGDIVLASYGSAHQACCPSPSSALTVEMGVGYEGVFADRKVWESYAWRHYVYGRYPSLSKNLDTVIPGYFNPDDFAYQEEKDDYFLCLGRVTQEKGVIEACKAADIAGYRIKIAGPGDAAWIKEVCPNAEYEGQVSGAKRALLLARAKGLVCFTQYVEPFGNVAVEAMASGTPVISSDWGAFTETVIQGHTGFRCSDVPGLVTAIARVSGGEIESEDCRKFSQNFTLEAVWPRYDQYFKYQHHLFKHEQGY